MDRNFQSGQNDSRIHTRSCHSHIHHSFCPSLPKIAHLVAQRGKVLDKISTNSVSEVTSFNNLSSFHRVQLVWSAPDVVERCTYNSVSLTYSKIYILTLANIMSENYSAWNEWLDVWVCSEVAEIIPTFWKCSDTCPSVSTRVCNLLACMTFYPYCCQQFTYHIRLISK